VNFGWLGLLSGFLAMARWSNLCTSGSQGRSLVVISTGVERVNFLVWSGLVWFGLVGSGDNKVLTA
jgi:hypothetical protein